MPAKIETAIRNGEVIAATQEIVQERLEEFADAHRRLKELHVSLDLDNPAAPVAEINTTIGTEKFVSKGSSNNVVQAVEDAIRHLQGELSQRLQARKEQNPTQKPEERNDSAMKIGGVVAAVLLALIVGFANLSTKQRSDFVIKGSVSVDGTPIENGSIMFVAKDGVAPTGGGTITNGNYVARVHAGEKIVLVLGHKKVGEEPEYQGVPDSPMKPVYESVADPKFNAAHQSPLTATITEAQEGLDFDVTAAK